MNKNFAGPPDKGAGNTWKYTVKTGDPIDSPFTGTFEKSDTDYIIIKYSQDCIFYAKIGPLINHKTSIVKNQPIGDAKNNEITLEISKTPSFSTSLVDPDDFFDKDDTIYPCFKKTSTGSGAGAAAGATVVATKSTASYNPYKVAAAPFYAAQGGLSAVKGIGGITESELEKIKEDIIRIKQLIK